MKFLVPNYSCPQNPLTRGLPPPDPCSLCPLSSTEFVEPPPEQNSWVCHWLSAACISIACDVLKHTRMKFCVDLFNLHST